MTWIWLAILGLPLVLAGMVPFGGAARRTAVALAPFAAVPALLAAIPREPVDTVYVEWLLLGSRIGLDQTGQVFLLLTALLWTVAGIYARAYLADDSLRYRFFFFFLLTMTGNLGLVLAQDVVTFYTTFALMTFAAYGLVVYTRGRDALKAGKVYIVMAVIGEGFLLAGLVMATYASGETGVQFVRQGILDSARSDLIIGCLFAGFGIKAGAIPLHIWLPLAHPVAPTPASAVLSGAMIKAGMLGWIRFLPVGEAELAGWGALVVIVSLTSAFFGVLFGLTQEDPKTVLAYSSISQIGIITTVIAVGLAEPNAWEVALAGLLIYVLHHGLVKGVLFLGVGVAHETGSDRFKQRLVLVGLTIAALALSGAPLTTGALSKAALKEGVYIGPAGWAIWLEWLLPAAAVGTTVLMGRFLWIIWWKDLGHSAHGQYRGMAVPWLVLLVLSVPLVWGVSGYYGLGVSPRIAFQLDNLWIATWPVLVGGVILFGVWLLIARTAVEVQPVRVPAGDLLIPVEWTLARIRPETPEEVVPRPPDPIEALSASWYGLFAESVRGDRTSRFAHWLVRWDVAGLMFLTIGLVLVTLMLWS
jgi:formate hydrogenlyase subunit 3/multisubunit Na+/H+ antiporter MnhD subunit